MEYKKTFPSWFRVLLLIFYTAMLVTFVAIVANSDSVASHEADRWSSASEWTIGISITPFVALMGSYVWAQSKVDSSGSKISLISFVFPLFGLSIVGGILSIMAYKSTEYSDYAVFGFAFASTTIISMLAASLTMIQVWDVSRSRDAAPSADSDG